MVVGLAHSVHWAAVRVHSIASDDGRWMAWNLLLALVPVAIARPLFMRVEPRRAAWWFGIALFTLMLPNTAYVVTDVVHFFDHVRRGASNLDLAVVIVPWYIAYMAVGFGGYVYCLEQIRNAVRARAPEHEFRVVLLTHAVCAFGIYLGRFARINSWDAVAAPGTFAAALSESLHRQPALFVGLTFGALVVLATLAELVVDGYRARTAPRSPTA